MVEIFKNTPIRRMSTGGNYVNLTADVVLLSDYEAIRAVGAIGESIHLTEYEIQVLIGCSIHGCKMSPDRVFNLTLAQYRLYILGLVDRSDGLAIVTEKGRKIINKILSVI